MRKIALLVALFFSLNICTAHAQIEANLNIEPITATVEANSTSSGEATASAMIEPTPSSTPEPRPDLTQSTQETIGPLEQIIAQQNIEHATPFNFVRFSIKRAVDAGVPPNTIVLLLLLPVVAAIIAASRHMIGLRGFGIFLPAALSVVFVAIGPLVGILFFLLIVFATTSSRLVLKKMRIKLQYLPKMALLVWVVSVSVLAVLFMAPLYNYANVGNISIFPLLILVLLAESFSKVQTGKSARTAVAMASETIVMSLVSYIFLTMTAMHQLVLMYPEAMLLLVLIGDILLGKYIGLRFVEYWRYRKLISKG